MKKYRVTLAADEHEQLSGLIATGKVAAQKWTHAHILLKADPAEGGPGWIDEQIAEAIEVSVATIERVRQRFVEEGLEPALARKKPDQPSRAQTRRGRRGPADRPGLLGPAGRPGRLDHAIAGRQTGRTEGGERRLRRDRAPGSEKSAVKPWLQEPWCIPGGPSGAFVAAMEDVIAVYHRPTTRSGRWRASTSSRSS